MLHKVLLVFFTSTVGSLKALNEEIEKSKQKQIEERDNLNYCIKELEIQQNKNNLIMQKN